MTKTIKILANHPASPASKIEIDLNVSVPQEEIDGLFTSKAIFIIENQMGMEVSRILSARETYQQLELDFDTETTENNYQPYTLGSSFNCEVEEESESEEESVPDTLTGRDYTPYSQSQEQPPQSFHERLPGTGYTPYRSFRNPIERS